MASLTYLKEILEAIRSTTRPLQDAGETDSQWAEVFNVIDKLAATDDDSRSAAVAKEVKEYLDEHFENPRPYGGFVGTGLILFSSDKGNMHTIKIEE